VSCAKTAELIQMQFGMLSGMGQHALHKECSFLI